MAYDEHETKRSTVVVDTPVARREVTRTDSEYAPERNTGATVALVILAIAVIGLLGLLFWSMQANSNNENLAAQQQPTPQTIIQQPAQQPPVIVQQPAATQSAPIVVTAPASAPNTPGVLEDGMVQQAIDHAIRGNSTLSTLDVTATVQNGKVLLVGSVKSDQLKNQVEKTVRSIKGVHIVDNQITVAST